MLVDGRVTRGVYVIKVYRGTAGVYGYNEWFYLSGLTTALHRVSISDQ